MTPDQTRRAGPDLAGPETTHAIESSGTSGINPRVAEARTILTARGCHGAVGGDQRPIAASPTIPPRRPRSGVSTTSLCACQGTESVIPCRRQRCRLD